MAATGSDATIMAGLAARLAQAAVRAGRVLLPAAAIGLGVFLLFLALGWASLGLDRARMAMPIRTAFAQGDLKPDASWLFGDTDIGSHQYNDCLILFQATDDRASRPERAASPLSVTPDPVGPCRHLERLAAGAPDTAPAFYHHYLHAATTLARLLVPALGVRGTRELYRLALSLLLLAGLAYPMVGLARGIRRDVNGAFLIIAAAFARWFGLETFGQSLGHAPADAVVLAYIVFLVRSGGQRGLSRRAALIGTALAGAMTMETELLTGGLPLGLAVVLGALPLALADDGLRVRTTLDAALAYTAAAAACLVAKLALVVAWFGLAPLRESAGQVAFRAGISRAANHDQPAGAAEFASHVWAGLDSLAPGMQWLVAGVLVLSVVAGGWAYRRLRRADDAPTRERAVALAGSNLVVLLWFVVFWQHTSEHAWFIDRLLVWPIASGMALFFLAVVAEGASPAQRGAG